MKISTILLILITCHAYGDIKYSINDKKIGNIIKAKVDGKEVQLTTQDEMECYLLSKVLDFNNDGYKDALITHQVACGGNASPNNFFFITYNKKTGFTKTKVFATSWEVPSIEMINGNYIISLRPFILGKDLDQIPKKSFALNKEGNAITVNLKYKTEKVKFLGKSINLILPYVINCTGGECFNIPNFAIDIHENNNKKSGYILLRNTISSGFYRIDLSLNQDNKIISKGETEIGRSFIDENIINICKRHTFRGKDLKILDYSIIHPYQTQVFVVIATEQLTTVINSIYSTSSQGLFSTNPPTNPQKCT